MSAGRKSCRVTDYVRQQTSEYFTHVTVNSHVRVLCAVMMFFREIVSERFGKQFIEALNWHATTYGPINDFTNVQLLSEMVDMSMHATKLQLGLGIIITLNKRISWHLLLLPQVLLLLILCQYFLPTSPWHFCWVFFGMCICIYCLDCWWTSLWYQNERKFTKKRKTPSVLKYCIAIVFNAKYYL